jgi:hypothetical protein
MDFNEFKNMSVWELIKQLEKETKSNARKVKENSLLVVRLLNDRKHGEAQKIQKINQDLIQKNGEFIKLHNALLAFYMSKKGVKEPMLEQNSSLNLESTFEQKVQLDFDEFYKKTIANELVFDKTHPFYCSDEFRKKLLDYYISIEDYEKCDLVTKSDEC